MEEREREPLALIGMGCRYPGNVNSPEEFWELLMDKRDALGPIPEDRWDADALFAPEWRRAGKINVKRGGFVRNVDEFDAGFFGISPLEAKRMDPQQRMLLELAYETMEDAGVRTDQLAQSPTGVFIGISAHDYGDIQNTPAERLNIGAHTNVGSALCITANRISYAFDLKGPSLALDTACSSSLTAVHTACRAIWNGDANAAFAGGVNSILKPEPQMGFSKGGFLSPDGTCYSFDERGNGYVRSEGAGLVLIKPLSQAEADGDEVYAVIRGSAVNQDGTTNGISVPDQKAQERLLRTAYEDAKVDPHKVGYVEAHGTGTFVGDPIESGSIGKVIGTDRQDSCYIGSVKSNVGHLEPASGIIGLSKMALSLKKGTIPPNIHFQKGNPNIDFESLRVQVPTEPVEWKNGQEGPLYGGVNSFGFGGSNVHVVLQSHEKKEAKNGQGWSGPAVCTISARDGDALKALAQRYIDMLRKGTDASLENICRTAAIRRSHHDHRLAVVATSKEELAEKLEAYLNEESAGGLVEGRANEKKERPVFIFSGQGPQWFAMGRELYENEPLFRSWIEKLDGMLSKHAEWSLLEELTKDEENSRISDTNIAQPAIFSIQIALYEMWKAMGIEPGAVVGHSIGEVAAGYVSGALTLEQAVLLIFHRSRVQFKATDKGRMLAVGLPYEKAKELVNGRDGRVSVGAVNGPEMVTLSGDIDEIEAIAEELNEKDVFHRQLMVNVPFHSHHMEPLKEELLSSLGADFQPASTTIPFYSTVEGKEAKGEELTPEYWYRNVREPVFFTSAIEAQVKDGFDGFIELGPHPIHSMGVEDILEQEGKKGLVLPSIRRKEKEKEVFLGSVGKLHTEGYRIDWKNFYGEADGFADLPRYPWQRSSYWIESPQGEADRLGSFPYQHPHLKDCTISAREPDSITWGIELDKRRYPYIEDHKVQGPIIYPGAGHVDLITAAARSSFGEGFSYVENLSFENGLFLPDSGEPPRIQLDISHDRGEFFIHTRPHGQEDAPWTLCSQGRIEHQEGRFEHIPKELDDLRSRIDKPVAVKAMQDELLESGLYLGPSFRNIKNLWRSEGHWEALSEIEVHESIQHEFFQYNIHPGVLDSCFQTVFGIFDERKEKNLRMGVYVPRHIERFTFYNPVNSLRLYVHGRLREWTEEYALGELWIFNEDGSLVAEFHGFRSQYLKGSRGEEGDAEDNWFYEYRWNMKSREEDERFRDPGQFLTELAGLKEPVHELLEEVRQRPEQDEYYEEYEPEQYRLTLAYIVKALRDMGLSLEKGASYDVEELRNELGVIDDQQRLFHHMFRILDDGGILEKAGEGVYEVAETPETPDTKAWMDDLKQRFPQFIHESTLLGRCGPRIREVLLGEVDPVQLIFPEEDWQGILDYYTKGFAFRKYNDIARKAVEKLIDELPEDQTLRILEVGAGTGGVTQALLPLLPPERTEYHFTDLSQIFMMKAREQFADYPFVEYKLLDIEEDPGEQGFKPHSFDLVIASDVIHATSRLDNTLGNVRKLLASEGVLLLLEVTNSPVYLDLIFGMTEGWWMFQDTDVRPTHATLAPDKWKEVLEANTFNNVTVFSDFEANEASCQSVILSRNEKLDFEEQEERERMKQEEGDWLLFMDRGGVTEKVASRLKALNKRIVQVEKGDAFQEMDEGRFILPLNGREDIEQVVARIAKSDRFEGIVYGWPLDLGGKDLDPDAIKRAEEEASVPLITLMGVLNDQHFDKAPALQVLFSGAENVGGSPELPNMEQEGVRGVARVITNEFPNFPTTLVDLSDPVQDAELDEFLEEAFVEEHVEELAFRGSKRYVNRLERISGDRIREMAKRTVPAEGSPYNATITEYGVLDNIILREAERRSPAPDEVEVKVKASALNFRDIMVAMGLLSDEAVEGGLFGHTFGLECSGVVTSVGDAVEGIEEGQEVMATAPSCLGGFVYPKGAHVVQKPEKVSWSEAASLPVVYTTAYFALIHHCRLEKGEKVLIHAAAGGVGIAAINIAQTIGAEIYATCGSKHKQEFLEKLGVKPENIMNSRTLEFADELMDRTNGEGVDVVLNSLSGDAIPKSIHCLAPYGRFVEIGKTDIYRNSKIGLKPFGNNLSYFGVDVDRLFAQKVAIGGRLFQEAIDLFVENNYEPHPVTVYPIGQLADAFQFMGGARHIGKVIVTMEDEVEVAPPEEIRFKEDGTYLITGGASGFGLAVADWMTRKGCRNLALMSRSGPKTDEEKAVIKEMEERGVNVLLPKGSVSDKEDMDRAFREIEEKMPPLKGVQHAAMVLDDGSIPEIDRDRYMKVFEPKAVGCCLLHEKTKDLDLDHFVSYSSISAIYGNPGQVSYVGANSFLDHFSHWRRAQGLPATTINWGVIGDVGFVARSEQVDESLSKQGWKPFTLSQALGILEQMLLNDPVQRVATDCDWETVGSFFPHTAKSSRFTHLVHERELSSGSADDGDGALLKLLLDTDASERFELLRDKLKDTFARVLGTSSDKLDPSEPTNKFGLDSLMANQVRNWIQSNFNVDFSMMRIMRGPTIDEMAESILDEISGEESSPDEIPDEEKSELDLWIPRKKKLENPDLRLFCFPYFAGGASVFRSWQDDMPDDIEVCPVQFPGREERANEKAYEDVESLVKDLASVIEPMLTTPCAFYAHSSGAGIAFELARYLRREKDVHPVEFIVGGWRAPHVPGDFEHLAAIPDDEVYKDKNIPHIKDHLRSLEIPENVIENQELFNEMLPSLRADILLGKNYEYYEESPLDCSITAIAGEEDSVFTKEDLEAWKDHSSRGFELRTVKGGHLFCRDNKEELLSILREKLERVAET